MKRSFQPALAAAALLASVVGTQAAEIKALSGNGAKAAVSELAVQFERATGHKVSIRFEVNSATKRRIEAGEAFDVAIVNPPVLDDLIRQGRIARETRAVIGRAGIGVGVREGAPRPDISTVETVARGEADLVVVVASRISGVPGVALVGRIPEELQTWIGFTAGVAAAAKEAEAGRAMLKFFTAPPAAAVLRSMGVEPFVE
jgi:molybdate transport system substrate-binding protein